MIAALSRSRSFSFSFNGEESAHKQILLPSTRQAFFNSLLWDRNILLGSVLGGTVRYVPVQKEGLSRYTVTAFKRHELEFGLAEGIVIGDGLVRF